MKYLITSEFSLIFLVFLLKQGNGDRTRDRMYDEVKGASACFRRMNATHQTGCSSGRQGSTGIVHLIGELNELKSLIQKGSGDSYVPVLPINLLDEDAATLLKSSGKISGLVLYKDNDTVLSGYTHENKCPNRNFALENTCDIEWNVGGTNVLNENFDFPMFYITNDTDLRNVKDCFYRFNNVSVESHNERSLCSLELSSFMLAAIDTPTCLRRSSPFFNLNTVKLCDPLGSNNIWASLFPVGNSTSISDNENLTTTVRKDMKYIVVAARLDTTSLFIDQEKGAANPVTSIVTLLYTAKLLKTTLPTYNENYRKNVMFVLLSGETYDYIGSQRLVYDLNEGQFPTADFKNENETIYALKSDDIHLIVELNQVSRVETMFAHVHEEKDAIREFVTKLKKYSGKVGLNDTVGRLPPSSMQTFAKSNLSGLVLTDHEKEYSNKFYNSMLDDVDNIKYEYYENPGDIPEESIQGHVANVAEMISKSLYEEVTGESPADLPQDLGLVNELFNCYLKNSSCKVHHAVGKKKLRDSPMSLYVGVSISRSALVAYAGLTLSWLTGDILNDTAPCPPKINSYIFKYYNMSKSITDLNKTVCYRSCMNFTEAVSPAFIIKDYDWSSNEYSSWTESVWRELSVRLFLRPSPSHEKMTFAIGSMVMALSFIFVYFVSSRSHVLFAATESTAPTRC